MKVGLFTDDHRGACLPIIGDLAKTCAIVVVLFADCTPDLRPFAAAGCAGVMLDTADKAAGPLLDNLSPAVLRAFVAQTRSLGLLCGLAGALRLTDIPALLPLRPDYLGFCCALCHADRRTAGLDPERLDAVRRPIPSTAPTGL